MPSIMCKGARMVFRQRVRSRRWSCTDTERWPQNRLRTIRPSTESSQARNVSMQQTVSRENIEIVHHLV